MKKYSFLFTITGFFYLLAVTLCLATGSIFYLINFTIIGTCVGLGVGLWPVMPRGKKNVARLISQATVGGYMFFGLGCGFIYLLFGYIMPENMQLEGFWFWLLGGVFLAGVIHYSVAKIFGPLLFNRAWCGWVCWTAAVLDLLPWKKSPGRLKPAYGYLRYLFFALSTGLVFVLFFGFGYGLKDTLGMIITSGEDARPGGEFVRMLRIPELRWFLIGNFIYYVSGIILAYALKDNRAFCKYICPITVFLKIGSRFSLMKVGKAEDKCTGCKACERKCPMDIRITRYLDEGRRVASTECILCHTCIDACPEKILKVTYKADRATKEYLRQNNGTNRT